MLGPVGARHTCRSAPLSDGAFIGPTTLLGGAGAIAASAHFRTADVARLVAAAPDLGAVTAARFGHDLLPIVDAGFAEPSPAV